MDFSLTDEQVLLRDTARRLLARECPPALLRAHLEDPAAADPLWKHLREFAALGAGSAADLCIFLDATGYVAAPGPFFATAALFAPLLATLGDPLLDGVLAGEATGTVALAGSDGAWVPNDGPVKTFVLEADRVDQVAVVGTHGVAIAAPAALEVRAVGTVDGSRRVFEVDTSALDGAPRRPLGGGALAALADRWHVAIAAETVGTARRILDLSVDYARQRHQFGVPIGSFQAIQHKCADMAVALERATAAVQYAAMTVDAGDPDRTRACHVAKAAAGGAARRVLKDGIQIHGGIGYTWEHDLHLFLRRATASEYLLGPASWHHDRIADLLFAAGQRNS